MMELHIWGRELAPNPAPPIVRRTKGEHCRITPHGPASRQAGSGYVKRGEPQRTPSQPGASQPACRPGILRAGVPGLPPGLQQPPQPATDPDSGAGVEAVVEVAVS